LSADTILTARLPLVIQTPRGKFPRRGLVCPCLTDPFSDDRTGDGADTKGEILTIPEEESSSSAEGDPESAAYGSFL
jgi:hypothetical protein